MNKYDLTDEEDLRLRFSIMLPGRRRSLYEYLCELPLEQLQAYPQKGYHWWMGSIAQTPQALALRDYILSWRLNALRFRQQYSRAYLETLSLDDMQLFLRTYIHKTPIWAYEGAIQDVAQILLRKANPRCAEGICNIW